MQNFTLILASASPRRRELLALLGMPFEPRPSDFDETQFPTEAPLDYARRLAEGKGAVVHAGEGELILSADTIVDLEGRVLGKPADPEEARAILSALRGKTHRVYTAFTLRVAGAGKVEAGFCQTDVRMRYFTETEMETYMATPSPYDKAGGYAIQDAAFHPVENIRGCYTNVMGLPLCHLANLFSEFGLSAPEELPWLCQQHLGITCRVYPEILKNHPVEVKP